MRRCANSLVTSRALSAAFSGIEVAKSPGGRIRKCLDKYSSGRVFAQGCRLAREECRKLTVSRLSERRD
jgi:hypothetical protein